MLLWKRLFSVYQNTGVAVENPGYRESICGGKSVDMGESWLREYIFLAFRIHKLAEAVYGSPFVETYYGPIPVENPIPAGLLRLSGHLQDGINIAIRNNK